MIYAPKLRPGDEVRVISPARSMRMISGAVRELAEQRYAELGLRITYSEHVEAVDEFLSSPVERRVADLHAAFRDREVKAVITTIGGFNSNGRARIVITEH